MNTFFFCSEQLHFCKFMSNFATKFHEFIFYSHFFGWECYHSIYGQGNMVKKFSSKMYLEQSSQREMTRNVVYLQLMEHPTSAKFLPFSFHLFWSQRLQQLKPRWFPYHKWLGLNTATLFCWHLFCNFKIILCDHLAYSSCSRNKTW